MELRSVVLVIAMAMVLPWSVSAAGQAEGGLDRVVEAALRECPHLTIFDRVNGRVEGDVVVLTGRVTTAEKMRPLERRLAGMEGVRRVRNEVTILPASRSDAELRHRVSRAIYGHPSFWSYAAMSRPPIHIIVENGHVTLAGVVESAVERAMARSLASGRGEVAVIDELQIRP